MASKESSASYASRRRVLPPSRPDIRPETKVCVPPFRRLSSDLILSPHIGLLQLCK
ncbi:hypothetical protein DL93DRAFT_2090834 [Clavulina sp. PMI_390]|nr:hypothetical protein DL93DRAFT_2090834 [Clavulina sp. PMI_390]